MNIPLLIDAIVRQTTVLLATLSTTAGLRAPLAQVANRVFLELVAELERQGVGRKVIADMFGLALRSYQQKVQRLAESATDQGTTLWEAVYRHVNEKGVTSRAAVLTRFGRDDAASVRGILNDLVGTGLVYKTGRGDQTVYRAAPPDEIGRVFGPRDQAAEAAVVWVMVYRDGPIDMEGLLALLRIDRTALERALAQLVSDGRVTCDDELYRAESCVIPVGHHAGWEAALLDHYQSVVAAICSKLTSLGGPPEEAACVGGSTLTFDVWPGHPHFERVRALLTASRSELCALWDEVEAHNAQTETPSRYDRVTFYFGQSVKKEGSDRADLTED